MAQLEYRDITITGMAGAVPSQVIENLHYTDHFSAEDAAEIVNKTGIRARRFAPAGTTAADLCYAAAKELIEAQSIEPAEIDVVLFVSQTPDYRMPATSIILQDRLGLAKHTAAFDINIGCSGFVYGLSVAYAYAQQPQVRRVLLLDGETRSRVYSPKDRQTAFLFGDGGVAAIIEKQHTQHPTWFDLQSDGSRSHLIKIDAGGYRQPSTPETLAERVVDEHGNIRSAEHGYMIGADVFSFVLREIPKSLKNIWAASGKSTEDVDWFVFHQANQYMNDYLAKKLKLPKEKVPQSLHKFGNTSSVSIPLTIVDQLHGQLNTPQTVLLCGFGVGMSWATALLPTQDLYLHPIIEVE